MLRHWNCVIILIAYCEYAIPSLAQSPMKGIVIKAPEVPGVSVTTYASAALPPRIDPLIAPEADDRMRNYSVVVTNATARRVVGIAFQWRWSDASGKPRFAVLRSDGLFLLRRDLAQANGKLLVAPDIILPLDPARSNYAGVAARVGRQLRDMEHAEGDVTGSLDCIIFSDGEVAGPDESRMMEYVQARTAVARSLGKSVLALIAQGADSTSSLSEIRMRMPGSAADFFGLWRFRIAGDLLAAPDRRRHAEELVAVPVPDLFRR
jgi:hypothetical protein